MNISKLREKISEKKLTVMSLANQISIDKSTLYRKLDGESQFSIDEAKKISAILGLTTEELNEIFFA